MVVTGKLLSRLIGSKADVFFEEHWERNFFILEKFGVECSHILTIADVDSFLSKQAISYPFIRIVKAGKEIPLVKYLRMPFDAEFRLIDSDKVLSLYSDGATIIFQKAHLWIERLGLLAENLQASFQFPVNCNVYITPPNSKGFAPHFDTHDVFILQVSGEKAWNLYDRPTPFALETESLTTQQSAAYLKVKPTVELTLKEKNLLYVPRGLVHDTFTLSKQSVHVTLGMFPPRGVDLLKAFTNAASQGEFFKKSIHQIGHRKPLAAFAKSLSAECSNVLNQFSESEIKKHFAVNYLGVPAQDNAGRFQDLLHLQAIGLDTQICKREKIAFIISTSSGTIAISFYDKTITFPNYVGESIHFITSKSLFLVREIDGCLDDAAKLVLVRKLVKEGFLKLTKH